jgi:hypothetical protein
MTGAGWFMMIVSITFVVGLVLFCFYRVATTDHNPDAGGDDDSPSGIGA